jgi:hypothetical protein
MEYRAWRNSSPSKIASALALRRSCFGDNTYEQIASVFALSHYSTHSSGEARGKRALPHLSLLPCEKRGYWQYIYVIPGLDLVVVTTASIEQWQETPSQEEEIKALVPRFILPAIVGAH